MDSTRLHSLITHVPTISYRVDLNTLTTTKGALTRARFAAFALLPIVYLFDQNGGLIKLGFSSGPSVERQFKMRPDYLTGKVFAAERQALPTFKSFY
jgi:hypothetical protein